MDFKTMTLDELEARAAEIATECDGDSCELNLEELEARAKELDAIAKELETRKAEEAAKAEIRKAVADGNIGTVKEEHIEEERHTMTNEEVRRSGAYIDAFANYIKSENDAECRALLTENVSGTVPVPELVYDIVKTAWEKEGIMALVKKTYLKGNLKVGFEISSTGAVVHTEAANSAVSEEDLVLGIVNLVPVSIKKWISISDEVYDLRGEAFLRYIYDEIAYQIAHKAADELVAKIIASPATSTTTAPAVPVVTATTVALDTIASALGNLSDEAANPVIIMNKATWSVFKAAQYSANYAVDPFEGLTVLFNNSMESFGSAATGETYAIVGDLGQGAQANFPNGEGLEIKFDNLTKMEYDLVRILGRQYVGVGVVAPNAFVKVVK